MALLCRGRRKYSMAAIGVLTRWCLGLSALYLMSSGGSMILCANLVSSSSSSSSSHHGRHHNHHHRPVSMTETRSSSDSLEYGGTQLEKSLLETTSKRPPLHHLQCPQCMHAGEFYSEKTAASSVGVNSETIRLEAIKEQILNKLGLKSKPIVSKKLPKEVVLQSLYRAEEDRESVDGGDWSQQQSTDSVTTTQRVANSAAVPAADAAPGSGAEIDDFYARTSEIITFAEEGSFLNEQRLVEFAHSDAGEVSGQELRIKAATLWVKVDFHRSVPATKRRLAHDKNVTLWVFRVLGHAPADLFANHNARFTSQEFDKYTEMSASIPVSLASLGWQKFDLTTTVRDWYTQKPKKHHGRLRLLIDCSGCKHLVQLHLFTKDSAGPSRHYDTYRYKYAPEKDSLSSGEQQEEEAAAVRNESRFYGGEGSAYDSSSVDDTNRPFLVIHTDPNVMRRVRRRALDCSGALKGQCCKQRFYVNFTNLGWDDWIIAPNGYYANYCKGDCGGAHRTPDTFLNYYTHVIEEYKKYGDLKGLQPCCAPMKFSSMSLIYFGPDSNIIKRDLPKMVVDECGCP